MDNGPTSPNDLLAKVELIIRDARQKGAKDDELFAIAKNAFPQVPDNFINTLIQKVLGFVESLPATFDEYLSEKVK